MRKRGVRKSGTICSQAGRQAVFEIGSEGLETKGEKGGSSLWLGRTDTSDLPLPCHAMPCQAGQEICQARPYLIFVRHLRSALPDRDRQTDRETDRLKKSQENPELLQQTVVWWIYEVRKR